MSYHFFIAILTLLVIASCVRDEDRFGDELGQCPLDPECPAETSDGNDSECFVKFRVNCQNFVKCGLCVCESCKDEFFSECGNTAGEEWDKCMKDVEPPTTEKPTTAEPTTEKPTTEKPPTAEPTTVEPPTTEKPTTAEPTTEKPTTEKPPTAEPTTVEPPTTESAKDNAAEMEESECPSECPSEPDECSNMKCNDFARCFMCVCDVCEEFFASECGTTEHEDLKTCSEEEPGTETVEDLDDTEPSIVPSDNIEEEANKCMVLWPDVSDEAEQDIQISKRSECVCNIGSGGLEEAEQKSRCNQATRIAIRISRPWACVVTKGSCVAFCPWRADNAPGICKSKFGKS